MKKITEKDLANNPIKRLASCLVLDTSESMGWQMDDGSMPIDELNKGVKMYFKAINNNEKFNEKVEVAIITFGNKEFSESTILPLEFLLYSTIDCEPFKILLKYPSIPYLP